MLFNSIVYAVFLPLIFFLYWSFGRKTLRRQNLLLIAAGFVFYGWWSWKFLGYLLLTSCIDFISALQITKHSGNKKIQRRWLVLSIACNLGVLGFFKYANFFMQSFSDAAQALGWHPDWATLQIVLPVGISFYTFQAMAYTIDVYRGTTPAQHSLVNYLAFISFFPQLVAGPIERASHMMPQFLRKRTFDEAQAVSGLRLILWGLVKKVVIADNLSRFVDQIYGSAAPHGLDVIIAMVLFTIQIYGDFSGYTDIARGSARLLGFELSVNFRSPYFAASLRSFWQRWHISLSTWFRDYLYIPLGGNRRGKIREAINLFVTFLISGLWHGASWTFVLWGALHGAAMVSGRWLKFMRKLPRGVSGVLTFLFVVFAFHFFRAKTIHGAFAMCKAAVTGWPSVGLESLKHCYGATGMLYIFLLVIFFAAAEAFIFLRGDAPLQRVSRPVRWMLYYGAVALLLLFGVFSNAPVFIYFQF